MPEARYPCPVCLGLPMQKLEFKDPQLTLDTCSRCGGMWFDYGEVNQLKHMNPKFVMKKVALREQDYAMQCHQCSEMMDRNADHCPACKWKNLLDCPICEKTMTVVNVGDVKLDVCKSCKGAWFDNIELSQIWNGQLDKLGADNKLQKGDGLDGGDAAALFLDVLTYSPHLAYYTAEAAVELARHAPEIASGAFNMIANSPEIAGSLMDGLGSLAGGIFEVIGAILEGIFDG